MAGTRTSLLQIVALVLALVTIPPISASKSYTESFNLKKLIPWPIYAGISSSIDRESLFSATLTSLLNGSVVPDAVFIYLDNSDDEKLQGNNNSTSSRSSAMTIAIAERLRGRFTSHRGASTSLPANFRIHVEFADFGPHNVLLPLLHHLDKSNQSDSLIAIFRDDEYIPRNALLHLLMAQLDSFNLDEDRHSYSGIFAVAMHAYRMGICLPDMQQQQQQQQQQQRKQSSSSTPRWSLPRYTMETFPLVRSYRSEWFVFPRHDLGHVLYHSKQFHRDLIFDKYFLAITERNVDIAYRLATLANNVKIFIANSASVNLLLGSELPDSLSYYYYYYSHARRSVKPNRYLNTTPHAVTFTDDLLHALAYAQRTYPYLSINVYEMLNKYLLEERGYCLQVLHQRSTSQQQKLSIEYLLGSKLRTSSHGGASVATLKDDYDYEDLATCAMTQCSHEEWHEYVIPGTRQDVQ